MFAFKHRSSATYVAAPHPRLRAVEAGDTGAAAAPSPALAMQQGLAAWASAGSADANEAEWSLSVRQSAVVIGGITAMLWCAIAGIVWLAIG